LVKFEFNASKRDAQLTLKGHKDYINAIVFQPEDGSQVIVYPDFYVTEIPIFI